MPGKFTIRETRGLVLVLLIITALATAGTYYVRLRYRAAHRTELPPRVPPNTKQTRNFSYSKTREGRTIFTIRASNVLEQQDDGRSVLEDVEIITYGAQGNRHDRIYTKQCEYDAKAEKVQSQGEVEIELASLPGELADTNAVQNMAEPEDAAKPSIFVKTSGVTYDANAGVVTTDQPLDFRFERGNGRATGAVYDSKQRVLQLKSNVELTAQDVPAGFGSQKADLRRVASRPGPPVFVTASALVYEQQTGQVRAEHVQIRRVLPDGLRELSADHGEMLLDKQNRVQSAVFNGNVVMNDRMARTPKQEARESRLTGNYLEMVFKDEVLNQTFVRGNVQLDVVSPDERTHSTAENLDLQFSEQGLANVFWHGGVKMVSTPVGRPGDVRTLTTEQFQMVMKPGGREIDAAVTYTAGRMELTPVAWPANGKGAQNAPAAKAAAGPGGASRMGGKGRRVLTADRIWMKFGNQNQISLLTAGKNARLESYPEPGAQDKAAKRNGTQPASVTTSDDLLARFSKDSRIDSLEQTGNFHYVDGDRQANAERAVYTSADEKIQLTGAPGRNPEVWDATTRTTARQIVLDDRNNTGIAEHEVRTVYVPQSADSAAPKKAPASAGSQVPGPLSSKDPVYVIAQRMVSNSKTGQTRYESAASGPRVRLWQDQDVIEARTVLLDREAKRLTAEGQVNTVLVESNAAKPPAGTSRANGASAKGAAGRSSPPSGPSRPISITSASMVYTDRDHRAYYEGHVRLQRQESSMTSETLDAYLLAPDEVKPGESRLERAIGRGAVEINDVSPSGPRRAGAEMAEYTTTDDKVVLSGGQPYVFDEQRGYMYGRQLTYYVRDDSIFVHGDASSRTYMEQRVRKRH